MYQTEKVKLKTIPYLTYKSPHNELPIVMLPLQKTLKKQTVINQIKNQKAHNGSNKTIAKNLKKQKCHVLFVYFFLFWIKFQHGELENQKQKNKKKKKKYNPNLVCN